MGGRGHDTFIFTHAADSTPDATDIILDFKAGEDTLLFSFLPRSAGILLLDAAASPADLHAQASAAFARGYSIVIGSDGRQGHVMLDSNADAQADMLIRLAGIKSIRSFSEHDFAPGGEYPLELLV